MLTATNVYIRPLTQADAPQLLYIEKKNQALFDRYSPARPENYLTIEMQQELIGRWEENAKNDKEYRFGIFLISDDSLIGTIGLFQVTRSIRESAIFGYSLDQDHNGKGYTTEAAKLVVDYAFQTLHLHRLEAGVMPHNIGSIRVLEKAGFHNEGLAHKNIKINGKWEDHYSFAIVNPLD